MRGLSGLASRSVRYALLLCALTVGFSGALVRPASAATTTTSGGFSLQVSPSPLVGTLEPGESSTFDLQIRNTSDQAQSLKMGLRSFAVDSVSGKVDLKNTAPSEIKDFVRFSDPTFEVQPGELFSQRIIVDTPASAGFTYSFAVVISQQNPPKAQNGQSAIQGSVAVFTLLSVNRPGAVSKLQLSKLSISRHVYEYLPATISVKLKNSGNTLTQPKGSIYIQRHSDDTKPLAVIGLNSAGGYILPGNERTLDTTWNDGFPHYISVNAADGSKQQKLVWDGGDFTKLRIGKYVAKVVAVYSDNGRDVPIQAELTFWVIPWRMLLILIVIVTICIVGAVTILRKSGKALKLPQKRLKRKKSSD